MWLYIKFRVLPTLYICQLYELPGLPPTALLQNGFLSAEGYRCAVIEYRKLHLHVTEVVKWYGLHL